MAERMIVETNVTIVDELQSVERDLVTAVGGAKILVCGSE